MEAFFVSTMVVGLAEIGDKTQILSLILAAGFQRPLPIIFGSSLRLPPIMPLWVWWERTLVVC
jgi:putative Ca2+/H+ antiporter (TMEM165/GDT1 family)